jgi:hypothetical protein
MTFLVPTWARRLGLGIFIAAWLALPVSVAIYILARSANVPIADTWFMVPVIFHYVHTGQVPVQQVLKPYASGRPVMERVVLLVDARYFGFNVQLVKLLTVPVTILEAVCAVVALRWALVRGRLLFAAVLAFPVALVIFSFHNRSNFLFEWNFVNSAAPAFAFLALLLIVQALHVARGPKMWLLVAAAFVTCCVASCTGESGTLSFFACGVILWLPPWRAQLGRKIVFTAFAAAFLVPFFRGVNTQSSEGLSHPLAMIPFVIRSLGSWATGGLGGTGLALGLGIAEVTVAFGVIVIFLADAELRTDRAARTAVGLIAFATLGALGVALARLDYGPTAPLQTRYSPFLVLMMFGIYLMSVRLYTRAAGLSATERPVMRRNLSLACFCVAGALALVFMTSALWSDVGIPPTRSYYTMVQRTACKPAGYLAVSRWAHGAHRQKVEVERMLLMRDARLSVFGACGPVRLDRPPHRTLDPKSHQKTGDKVAHKSGHKVAHKVEKKKVSRADRAACGSHVLCSRRLRA